MGSVLEKNSAAIRKRIEKHHFENEEGDEYEGSKFNGFPEYFRRKKIKLQNLDAELRAASDKPPLFKGLVIHVTGFVQPPLHILHKAIVEHGGGFLQYLDSKTMATHIVASVLPPKKAVDLSRYRIAKPAWIVDSIEAGKLLPWSDYRVLDEGPRQRTLKLGSMSGLDQASPRIKQGYREQTDNSYYHKQFKNSTVSSQPWEQAVEQFQDQLALGRDGSPAEKGPQLPTESRPIPQAVAENVSAILPNDDDDSIEKESPERPHAQRIEDPQLTTERLKAMTSEEHNAWLLSDPRLRNSSTANPDFIQQYYSESRLHHLSRWKAGLKSQMQRLAAEKGLDNKAFKRKPGARRYVMHVDFDSFFCAVSMKKYPQYTGKPTVVAHSNGPGSEIASCNYPARDFGVKNGMWMKHALEMCPMINVVPYDFPAYEEVSKVFYESILELGGVVQSVSIDEALVDITPIVLDATGSQGVDMDAACITREQEKADDLAGLLRRTVRDKTECEVSVGIGGNILQAKVALRKAKPAGQYHLKPADVLDVIGDLKVENLPGVAYNIGGKLEEAAIKSVKDLRNLSPERLSALLGPKTGQKLGEYARGIDNVQVGDQPPRKSVSAEVNWGIRFLNQPEAEEFVYNLCRELERRLTNEDVKGKQLTMKIMRRCLDAPLDPAKHLGHGKCDTFNKSTSFGVATRDWEIIGKEAVSILRTFKFSPGDLRGLGLQMTKLEKVKRDAYGASENSQKKLKFATFAVPSPVTKRAQMEGIDEGPSPQKESVKKVSFESELIEDDPATPRKSRMHPAMALAKAAAADDQARTPLNVGGTQFILPSNPDTSMLEALPNDIRAKLMRHRPRKQPPNSESSSSTLSSGSPSEPEAVSSQIEGEIFQGLGRKKKLGDDGHQTFQSPLGNRGWDYYEKVTPSKHKVTRQRTPTHKQKQQRGLQAGGMRWAAFSETPSSADTEDLEELDDAFLTELPEDVRNEVRAEHRRRQLAQRSRMVAAARAPPNNRRTKILSGGQTTIQFQPLPPRAKLAFGAKTLDQLKDLLDMWYSFTKDQGPNRDDVEGIKTYLTNVVCDEKDMNKAAKLVKTLSRTVSSSIASSPGDEEFSEGDRVWTETVEEIEMTVQKAVQSRGLAPLQF